jgi:hypothetical protein
LSELLSRHQEKLDRIILVVTKKRAILGFCLLWVIGLGYFAFFGIRTTRIETLRSIVSHNLKQGSSSTQVRVFLDAQHLDPSPLIKPEFMGYGRHDYSKQNVVVAVKRNTWVSLLYHEAIYLVFVFNDKGELVRWDVFPIYTGL